VFSSILLLSFFSFLGENDSSSNANSLEELGLEYGEIRLMDQLRLDVLNEYSTSEIALQNIDLAIHIPTFDEFVRHIFRPAWKYCRIHTELEMTMSFASVIVDTLHTVSDQIERRTYGKDSMKKTIASWETLIRQIRVILLLKSRMYSEKIPSFYTIHALTTGDLSLYHILAYDTLEFTLRVEQSQEHEERCREVINKRRYNNSPLPGSSSAVSVASSEHDADHQPQRQSVRNEVLVAWGTIADKRWRDLLNIAINEDTIEEDEEKYLTAVQSSSVDSATAGKLFSLLSLVLGSIFVLSVSLEKQASKHRNKRRKPLLLYFPEHNHKIFLGAYRSIILAQRWDEKIDSMERLALVCEHLFEVPLIWRSIVALEIYSIYLFPVIVLLVNFEEDKDNAANHYALPAGRKEQVLFVVRFLFFRVTLFSSVLFVLLSYSFPFCLC
jgi:hypothetical protein